MREGLGDNPGRKCPEGMLRARNKKDGHQTSAVSTQHVCRLHRDGFALVVEANIPNQHLSRNFCALDTSAHLPDLPLFLLRRRVWARD